MRFRFVLLYLVLLHSSLSYAQYFETGQDPASTRWNQIKTNRFTIIYPESYGQEGIAYAKSFDNACSKLMALFPDMKFRIPVILHTYTTRSNGYAAWAPKRIELFPTPEQNTIPLDPKEQLSVHELTHVLQMESLNKGFTRVMSVITGEQFTGMITSLLPLWFMEGDAVFAESALTMSGRGRSPSFSKELKAISIEKGRMYNYDKMINGSFRNFTPDHYRFGYQMVAMSYLKYDPSLWNDVLNFTANEPFIINPVNYKLKMEAGLTKKILFTRTFDSLRIRWTKDINNSPAQGYEILNPSKGNRYINYYSPVFAGADSIIAIKTSLSDPPSFVLINTSLKTGKRIHVPGEIFPFVLTYARGKIAWVETQPDPRWENRTFSVINVMDIKTKLTRQITRKSRYMAVAISPDGKTLAATENTPENKNYLVLIKTEKGTIINSAPAPDNAYLQKPQWSSEGEQITVIYLTEQGEGVLSYSPLNGKWKTIIDAEHNDLQSSFLRNDSLFYVSSSSGTDNVYILTPGNSISQLTKSQFGAYDPQIRGGRLLFSDYSSNGNNICITALEKAGIIPETINLSGTLLTGRFDTVAKRTAVSGITEYKPEPYRKWQHLFKFHSWMPFYADLEKIQADPTSVTPGFTLMTQNQLSTLISSFGYEYSDNRHKFHSRITWKGWYPVFESRVDYGEEPSIIKPQNGVADPEVVNQGLRYTNTLSVPLSFVHGRFSQVLFPSVSLAYRNSYVYIPEKRVFDYGQSQVSYRVYFSNFSRSGIRDIYPAWAQVIDYNYTCYPWDKFSYGNMSTLKTAFYVPGPIANHGIKFRFEYEIQKPGKFISNRASFPRSYYNIVSDELKFFSADYTMPLLYPDLDIPGFYYLKRIYGTLFYDYARGTNNSYFFPDRRVDHNYSETFKSFGITLLSEFYVLRIPFMITGGVQTTWQALTGSPVFELLFNIDIFGMKVGRNRM